MTGAAAWTVFQTPNKLTSTWSRKRLLLAGALGHHPDARVGHNDIHRAELRDTAGYSGPERGSVADVGLGGNNAPAQSMDLRYGPGRVRWRGQRVGDRVDLPTDVRDHVGTIPGQAHRTAATLSPGRSRDQRDLAVEPVTAWIPLGTRQRSHGLC
jgi:hypothetical protein